MFNYLFWTHVLGAQIGNTFVILSEFVAASQMTQLLLIKKCMGLFFEKNHILKCWNWLSLINWIEAITFLYC